MTERSPRERAMWKRWCALWPFTLALTLYPINNFVLRLAMLLAFAVLLTGLLYFYQHKGFVRLSASILGGIVTLFLVLPGRDYDRASLRRVYVGSVLRYEGTRYVWGGENRLGIDCSGLVRSGLIMANYQQGMATLNPRLVREGLSLWWHDCSAQALGEEYQHKTHLLFSAPSINQLDESKILPGDLAVTKDGVHVMVFLGPKVWLEADPELKRVVKMNVPAPSAWFTEPVRVMRWTELEMP